MRALALLVAALVPLSAGCAARQDAARAEVRDLRRQMDRYREQSTRYERRIRELEDRVFVLEDKLETAQVALDRGSEATPRLPVVRKHSRPAPPPDDPPAAEPLRAPEPTSANPNEVEVVYEGEAARENAPRPVLKLHQGNAPEDMVPVDEPAERPPARRAAARSDAGAYPDPAAVSDRLPVAPLPGGKEPPPAGDDPITAYRDAYAALLRKDHAAAVAGFGRFLGRWPDHDYADNSQYWLAEAHYDQRNYEAALTEFRRVVRRYPSGNKAPDALLKIGYCYAKLGDLPAARDVLSQVVEIYPKTGAARLAAKRLEEMRE